MAPIVHLTADQVLDLHAEALALDFVEEQDPLAEMFERLAANAVDQDEFFTWVGERTRPRTNTD